jgi:two-component system, OmpR family, phosphate regulon sensor histidine kinase PhoR
VTVRMTREDGSVLLEIVDTGIGIPAGEQKRLFDRFFRSTNAVASAIPGTGLGLHIARAIAVAHGGDIHAESDEGRGTSFTVALPAAPSPLETV